VKVINPYEKQKWFSKWHPLIQIVAKYLNIDSFHENEDIFLSLNEDLKKNQTLWYPSAGFDVTDIINVNNEIFPEFEEYSPNVFIHNDMCSYIYDFRKQLEENEIHIINEICLFSNYINQSKSSEFHLFNTSLNGKKKWVMFFPELHNEKLLAFFLDESIQINFIYSVCDGILDGMGGGFPNAIPTKFYSFFYKALKTNYHISQFHNHIRWSPFANDYIISNMKKFLNDIRQENKFDINKIDEVENSFKNPIAVFNRFVNFGNCRELWLRII